MVIHLTIMSMNDYFDIYSLGCIWIKDLVREKEVEMKMEMENEKVDESSSFFISISFSLTKSLIQTRP